MAPLGHKWQNDSHFFRCLSSLAPGESPFLISEKACVCLPKQCSIKFDKKEKNLRKEKEIPYVKSAPFQVWQFRFSFPQVSKLVPSFSALFLFSIVRTENKTSMKDSE